MGGGGGGGDTNAVTYTNLIPTYIPDFQTWVEAYLAEALSLSGSNFSAYTGETYAAQDANETDGIAAVAARGRAGSAVELDGKAHLRDLYDGLKININPKLDEYFNKKIEELLQEFDEEMLPRIRAGHVFAYGGSEHNVAEARAASAVMARINDFARAYYDDYRHERSLQQQGMAHATPYGLQCIRDMEMLRQAGVYAREYAQGSLMDAWEQHNEDAIIPVRNLDILGNSIRTILSTYRQQTTKYYKPPAIAQIAGVALAGLSLYSMFSGTSMNPYTNPATKSAPALTSGIAEKPKYEISFPGKSPGGTFFGDTGLG